MVPREHLLRRITYCKIVMIKEVYARQRRKLSTPSQVLVKLQLQMRPMDIHEVRIRCHGQLDWNLWCASTCKQLDNVLCMEPYQVITSKSKSCA
jgi:hypothetical protein